MVIERKTIDQRFDIDEPAAEHGSIENRFRKAGFVLAATCFLACVVACNASNPSPNGYGIGGNAPFAASTVGISGGSGTSTLPADSGTGGITSSGGSGVAAGASPGLSGGGPGLSGGSSGQSEDDTGGAGTQFDSGTQRDGGSGLDSGNQPISGGTGGGGAGGSVSGTDPTSLPTATEACPNIVSGTATFLGKQVQLWVGPAGAKGPLLLYWHATLMSWTEVQSAASTAISEVQSSGGMVASFYDTNGKGTTTGNAVWYTGDFDVADEVVACGIEAGVVDPQHIHTSGYSAGGLQCGAMAYMRSGYLASALCFSGGTVIPWPAQDASYVPPSICAHGAQGSDVLVMDFATGCTTFANDIAAKGGFAVNCNDGGDHLGSMMSRVATMNPVGWQFFKEHPWGTRQSPYASGLPDMFPDYCQIATK